MPLENSFYFQYLARGHHSIVGVDIGDDRLHRFPLVSAWAALGSGKQTMVGSTDHAGRKKYAGAFRTTHRIVSHRREPWSGLRATAACPSAQRARIRIRNCSQRLNQSVAGLLFLFWPSGPAASRNSIAIAGLSEGVHFLLWVHCATNHVCSWAQRVSVVVGGRRQLKAVVG